MPRAKVENVKAEVLNEEPTVENEEETVEELEEEPEVVNNEEEEYDSYKMDPELEVWPGGPNFRQINEWKEKFGDIYITEYAPGKYVAWRTLTRYEYRRLVKSLEQAMSTGQVTKAEAEMNNEEHIAELCILSPTYSRTDGTANMAGLASTISQQVMDASAFVSLDVRQL